MKPNPHNTSEAGDHYQQTTAWEMKTCGTLVLMLVSLCVPTTGVLFNVTPLPKCGRHLKEAAGGLDKICTSETNGLVHVVMMRYLHMML